MRTKRELRAEGCGSVASRVFLNEYAIVHPAGSRVKAADCRLFAVLVYVHVRTSHLDVLQGPVCECDSRLAPVAPAA